MSQSEEKSSLYEIYENDDLNTSVDEIYRDLQSNLTKSETLIIEKKIVKKTSLISILFKILSSLIILSLLGNLYNQLYLHLFNSYNLKFNHFSYYLNLDSSLNNYLIHSYIGVFLGLIIPIIDLLSNRKDNDNLSTIIRPLVAILGILFAIKKIDWISINQISIIWLFLNLGLWAFIDSTLLILSYSLALSVLGLLLNNAILFDLNYNEIFLIVDYLWFGGLLFGKVGRSLFN